MTLLTIHEKFIGRERLKGIKVILTFLNGIKLIKWNVGVCHHYCNNSLMLEYFQAFLLLFTFQNWISQFKSISNIKTGMFGQTWRQEKLRSQFSNPWKLFGQGFRFEILTFFILIHSQNFYTFYYKFLIIRNNLRCSLSYLILL